MTDQLIKTFLEATYNTIGAPLIYRSSDGHIYDRHPYFSEDQLKLFEDRAEELLVKLKDLSSEKTCIMKIHPSLAMTGLIYNPESGEYFYVGPVASEAAKKDILLDYLFEMGLHSQAAEFYLDYLMATAKWSAMRFKDLLILLNHSLNKTIILPDDIPLAESLENIDHVLSARRDFYRKNSGPPETDRALVSDYSQQLSLAMLSGNVDKLTEMLGDVNMVFSDMEYYTDLEEERLTGYGSIYGYERMAEYAGVLPEIIGTSKQYYLRRISQATSVVELRQISIEAMYDFTRLIGENKSTKTSDPSINKAIIYIDENIQAKLTAADVARAAHVSEHYLFTHFARETGKNLSEYINEEKIKKACHYMAFTDHSLAEIADFLSFSSQSYFQTVFKRVMGMTPREWKKAQ